MRLVSKNENNSSEEELDEGDVDDAAEGEEEEEEEEEEDDDADEGDEGDEVDDNDDFVDEKENIPANNEILQRVSLGGANKKIILKKYGAKKPSTAKLVDEAIKELNERTGSSTDAIRKFIMNKNPDLIEKRLKLQIKRYINNCLADGTMVQIKRSFKLTKKHAANEKQIKKAKLETKKKKQKEKEKEKLKAEKKPKPEDTKTKKKPENKKEEVKTNVKPKVAKETKKEIAEVAQVKKQKQEKDAKNTTESKKLEKPNSKTKLYRKSINIVIKPPSPKSKTTKTTKTAAKGTKKEEVKAESFAPSSTSTAVKASGRGKKK